MADFVKELRLSGAVVLLAYFCCSASGQLLPENFTVDVTPAQLVQARDSTATFSCLLSIGVAFRQQYEIQWVFVSKLPWISSVEKVLAENDRVNSTSPGKYSAQFSSLTVLNESIFLVFTINNVTDTDDGRYLCRAVRLQDRKTHTEAEASLTVQREADGVLLAIHDTTKGRSSDYTYLAEGRHDMQCEVYNFNPPTDYELFVYIGDREVRGEGENATAGELVFAEENARTAGAPRWRLERSLSRVNFTVADTEKIVRCLASNRRLNSERNSTMRINVTRIDSDVTSRSPSDTTATSVTKASSSVLFMASFPVLAGVLVGMMFTQ